MKTRKAVALFLSVLLTAGMFSGCSLAGTGTAASPTQENDVIEQLAGMPADTVLLTVNGKEVTAEEYLFWLSQSVGYMDQYAQYMGQQGIDWTQDVSGVSMADYCRNDALETAKFYAVVEQRAAETGCTFTAENQAAYQDELADMVKQLGGQENYALWLSRAGLSQAGMDHLNQVSYLYQDLRTALYGDNGPNAPTDADMDAYIQENDLLSAKHILLLTVDKNDYNAETGVYASLEPDVVARKKARAEELLAQLRASKDPAALFDTLMKEYSEDSGLASNPDGYVFTAGEMEPAFEAATRALAIGEISDVVESGYGYHIILRQDPDTAELRSKWTDAQMDAMMEELTGSAKVETKPEYDKLDVQDYYTKLLAHQEEIDARLSAAASPSPDASASPSAAAESPSPEPSPSPSASGG